MKLSDEQQFISYLVSHHIYIKDYDYIEGKTDMDDLYNKPIMRYKRWYENPQFWFKIYSNKEYGPAQRYMFVNHYMNANAQVLGAVFSASKYKYSDRIMELVVRSYTYSKLKNNKPIDMEDVLYDAMYKDPRLFSKILEYMKEIKYTPRYGSYGNLYNGAAFTKACSEGWLKIVHILLDEGADPSKDDSMGFIMTVKHGQYRIALELLDKGANIRAKHSLGYKMFLRNDRNRWCLKGQEEYHNILMSRFKEAHCIDDIIKKEDK